MGQEEKEAGQHDVRSVAHSPVGASQHESTAVEESIEEEGGGRVLRRIFGDEWSVLSGFPLLLVDPYGRNTTKADI